MTEEMINQIGFDLLGQKLIEGAIVFFRFNVEKFPNSYNAYDSWGEAYLAQGEYESALKSCQQSLDINPHNDGAIKKRTEIKDKMRTK